MQNWHQRSLGHQPVRNRRGEEAGAWTWPPCTHTANAVEEEGKAKDQSEMRGCWLWKMQNHLRKAKQSGHYIKKAEKAGLSHKLVGCLNGDWWWNSINKIHKFLTFNPTTVCIVQINRKHSEYVSFPHKKLGCAQLSNTFPKHKAMIILYYFLHVARRLHIIDIQHTHITSSLLLCSLPFLHPLNQIQKGPRFF